jgi:hypothetical protein
MKLCFLCCVMVLLTACRDSAAADRRRNGQVAPGVQLSGRIRSSNIRESSGIAASRRFPEVFWTHNDGGNPAQKLFAMRRTGEVIADYLVTGARFDDWEDIAADSAGHLYLADTGNNEARRSEISVHQVTEPDPAGTTRTVAIERSWRLRFPGASFDCEGLFILGTNGYVISKVFDDARAEIYRFSLGDQKEPATLEFVARTRIDSPVTGADVSADGDLLGIVAKSGAFAYRIAGDPARAAVLKPHQTKFKHEHIEGCTFVREGLLATAESKEIFLFTDAAFHPATK